MDLGRLYPTFMYLLKYIKLLVLQLSKNLRFWRNREFTAISKKKYEYWSVLIQLETPLTKGYWLQSTNSKNQKRESSSNSSLVYSRHSNSLPNQSVHNWRITSQVWSRLWKGTPCRMVEGRYHVLLLDVYVQPNSQNRNKEFLNARAYFNRALYMLQPNK